ncbi:replication protein A 14 kDa subunit B-like isoform X1 [Amaranthus tricolor]|uniref:replication protein A 14 kDa subunit B-like isoform X1 n=2 Tax=Amaranthus tricolor TaxID=29722 RepID=UPI002582CC8B|nr:replication protein A 14 kDa subunit B-like isoform X1 [Amaranthus tricolor]XP_057518268.1 replication protein A 14 kDa subunit B-like isoform X1 [Amaranthus tricolor]
MEQALCGHTFQSVNMDTSSPAVFVNGELLRMFIGRKVRIVVQVMQSDAGSIIGKSTDNQQVIIKNSQPTQPLTTYVEAIGIADSNQSVRAEILTNFGDNFDAQNYNELCQLANGEYKHLFL